MCHLSVVIPAYEEACRLPQTMPQLAAALEALRIPYEVILVIEPGADDSAAVAGQIAARYGWRLLLPQRHEGKGSAVRRGMLAASGDIICYMDADMSTDLQALSLMLERFEASAQTGVVIGDRRHCGSVISRPQIWLRSVLGQVFNRFVRLLFPQITTHDTQCGFKGFRRKEAHYVFSRQRINGFAFDVEVLLLAARVGTVVEPIPVQWTDSGRTSVRLLRHGSNMLADLLRLRFGGLAG